MFRQGQLAVHGLAILLGRNEAGISNRGKFFLHHAVCQMCTYSFRRGETNERQGMQTKHSRNLEVCDLGLEYDSDWVGKLESKGLI